MGVKVPAPKILSGTARKRLDALSAEYRLAPEKQRRAEELLALKQLQNTEEKELEALLTEADEILLRRAQALNIEMDV